MRDISHKSTTLRTAVARATLRASAASMDAIRERRVPKGDVLEISRVAAVQAAKFTSHILPFCHPILVEWVGVEYAIGADEITVTVTVKAIQKTGVEMEALTAASAAALNIYDMLKMIDDEMEITGVRLLEKHGGKSDWKAAAPGAKKARAAVVVISDSVAAGRKEDTAGRAVAGRLEREGLEVAAYEVVPDEPEAVAALLVRLADEGKLNLVLTTGGTGLSKRDRTPEAMERVIECEAPGIVEAARAYGQARTHWAMLSRGRAGLRGETLIVNLPGSRRGAAETLDALFPGLLHALKITKIAGGGHADA